MNYNSSLSIWTHEDNAIIKLNTCINFGGCTHYLELSTLEADDDSDILLLLLNLVMRVSNLALFFPIDLGD